MNEKFNSRTQVTWKKLTEGGKKGQRKRARKQCQNIILFFWQHNRKLKTLKKNNDLEEP